MCYTDFQMRIVIDTNILFEGLTKKNGACFYLIQSWDKALFEVSVSYPLYLEYYDVLSRKLSSSKWEKVRPILGRLLSKATPTEIYYRWRPLSPDPSDDFVIDCALNANAILVTNNTKDFIVAQQVVGLRVLKPIDFIQRLVGDS